VGACPEPPICQKITWRIEKLWAKYSEEDAEKLKRIQELAAARSRGEGSRKKRRTESLEFLELLFPKKTGQNKARSE